MIHVIAVLSLSVMCVLWFLVQRATGRIAGCSGDGDGSCKRKGSGEETERKGSCLYCGPKSLID